MNYGCEQTLDTRQRSFWVEPSINLCEMRHQRLAVIVEIALLGMSENLLSLGTVVRLFFVEVTIFGVWKIFSQDETFRIGFLRLELPTMS